MKVCKNCGAQNSDSRTFCIDCGKKLGKPLTGAEAEMAEAALDEAIERSYQNSDELRPKRKELVFAVALALCFVGACFGYHLAPATSGTMPYFLASAVLAPVAIFTTLGGKLMWRLERWRLAFRYDIDDDIPVSTAFVVSRKISIWFIGGLALLLLGLAILQLWLPGISGPTHVIVDGQIIPVS